MARQSGLLRLIALPLSLVAILTGSSVGAAWVNVTNNLAGHASNCGNLFALVAVPGQNKIIVSVCGNQGLFASTDNGTSWRAMGSSTNWVDPQNIVFDKSNPTTFWESGIHGGFVHKTTDGGTTFSIVAGVNGGDGMSVDMSDPQRRTIVVGTHEGSGLWKSTDGGTAWSNITAGTSGWTNFPIVIDSLTYVEASTNGGGISRTVNGGSTWTTVASYTAGWDPLVASNGNLYFAASGNQAILRSTNQGLTWSSIAKPGDGNGWYSPVEMPDGSIVAIGQGKLVQCSNGTTWTTIVGSLPAGAANIGNIAYNSVSQAFFMAFWDCNSAVPANAIWKYDYAVTAVINHGAPHNNAPSHYSGTRVVITSLNTSFANVNHASSYDLYGRMLSSRRTSGVGVSIERVER